MTALRLTPDWRTDSFPIDVCMAILSAVIQRALGDLRGGYPPFKGRDQTKEQRHNFRSALVFFFGDSDVSNFPVFASLLGLSVDELRAMAGAIVLERTSRDVRQWLAAPLVSKWLRGRVVEWPN